MAEDLETYLNEFGIDPKETESLLGQLSEQYKEVLNSRFPTASNNIEYLDFILKSVVEGREVLGKDKLDKSLQELEMMYYKTEKIGILFFGLLGCIKSIGDSSVREIAFSHARGLFIHAIYGVDKVPVNDSNSHHFVLTKRAKAAREKRASSPQEDALMASIEAELGASSISRPHKEAEAMLDAVNRRLGAAGFRPVKVDVVRRRLEKRAALLKSAEKVPE